MPGTAHVATWHSPILRYMSWWYCDDMSHTYEHVHRTTVASRDTKVFMINNMISSFIHLYYVFMINYMGFTSVSHDHLPFSTSRCSSKRSSLSAAEHNLHHTQTHTNIHRHVFRFTRSLCMTHTPSYTQAQSPNATRKQSQNQSFLSCWVEVGSGCTWRLRCEAWTPPPTQHTDTHIIKKNK